MQTSTYAMLLAIIVLLVLLVMVLIVIGIAAARYNRVFAASSVAFKNNLFCQPQEGLCLLASNDNLPFPSVISSEFSFTTARYCADLVARVELLFYTKHGSSTLTMPPGLVLRQTMVYTGKTIGFVAQRGSTAWVVFRGTADEAEWRQDFNFSQTDLFLRDEDQVPKMTTGGHDLSCHAGFVHVYDTLQATVRDAVVQIAPDAVVVTGHSLGAALATLASLDLSSDFAVFTYLFASPRVCDRIPDVTRCFWRINNMEDVVISIPLAVMPNVHNKEQPYFYAHGGLSQEFSSNRLSLTNNHLLPVYIDALDRKDLRPGQLSS